MHKNEDSPSAPSRDQDGDRAARLIIDMINCFDDPELKSLKAGALAATTAIARLRREFEARGLPVVYVNDNFGEWHSERSRIIERALANENPVTGRIVPKDDDYFVLKPQFSGFYASSLTVLLPKLGARRLVLTGVATDICVLFTAADAHSRRARADVRWSWSDRRGGAGCEAPQGRR